MNCFVLYTIFASVRKKVLFLLAIAATGCAIQGTRVDNDSAGIEGDIYSRSVIDVRHDEKDYVIASVIDKREQPVDNLINQIRKEVSWHLRYLHHKSVKRELSLMKNNQRYVDDTYRGAQKYLRYLYHQVKQRNMPTEIAFLPGVESQYKPFAYSFSHASGMWQIIPSTAEILGLKVNWWQDQRRDIVASSRAALNYLESLYKRFDNDWLLALAGYNAGPLRVESAVRKNKRAGKATDFWSLRLPKETKSYVPRLIALVELTSNPQRYGVKIPNIEDKDTFTSIQVDRQLDIHHLAEKVGYSSDELIAFNGGLNQRFTTPLEKYLLHVPVYMKDAVQQYLDSGESHPREYWISYKFSSGETLAKIAKKFDTSVGRLAEVNQIGSTLKGRYLLVPVNRDNLALYSSYHDEDPDKVVKKTGITQRYRMKRGDSLWRISRMFKVSINDLMRWNNIRRDTVLFVGKSIYIKRPSYTREPPIQLQPKLEHKVLSKVYYPVQSGDTLYSIANKFSINSKDIISWNPGTIRKGILPARRTIVLHVDVTKTY